ncbi:MAG TPA: hypothetical protein VG937_09585 [Polyangiaceae bacterium]|nr:hypothetical protein [Polyangiaceae bacterium]
MVFSRFFSGALLVFAATACGGSSRFPLRAPLLEDDDRRPFSPMPEEYESPFAWDAANQTIFRPVSRFFAVDPAGPAVNVNALDEVPNSSWFENRIGVRAMTPAEVIRGSCSEQALDPKMPDGSWIIDHGKDNGANPGFRVNIKGLGKFMLKTDPETEPDRATGATAIASRVYYAAGYYSPCDTVVYFRPSLLHLKPGLKVTNNQGVTRPFDQQRLEEILKSASHRDGLVRMVASEWLPGKPLGPYTYDGKRDDDPNDVIPHEDRRELRGERLISAWLNHFDSREQNTLDVFMFADPKKKEGPGHVVHYIIDMGDCFGSVWTSDGMSRRLGNAYMLDMPYLVEDFLTLGVNERPWEKQQLTGGVFNYFSARDFDPELWRGEYPNPAYGRMVEGDGAWAARIIARFTDELVAAFVSVGKYDPQSERYLTETLIARRDVILRHYLSRLSPLTDLKVQGQVLSGVDLARKTRIVPNESLSPRARVYRGESLADGGAVPVRIAPDATFSLQIAHSARDGGDPDDAPARYLVVDVFNGYAPGPLRVHLYDLGPARGFRLAGIERPENGKAP